MFLIHRLNHHWQWAVELIELSQWYGCVAIIQIILQHDLTQLWVKCDTTAAAHYFDILPSGSVPVTQRLTSPANPDYQNAHPPRRHANQAPFKGDEKKIWLSNCLPLTTHSVQIQISKHCTHSIITTIACTQRNYFGLSKKYICNYLFFPVSCPFLRTLKSQNHFPFSSHSVPPQKAPDSCGSYQLQWRENKGALWNSYSASLKGKLGR